MDARRYNPFSGLTPTESAVTGYDLNVAAQEAYKHPNARKSVSNFAYIRDKSTSDRAVYKNHDTGEYIVSYRGTNPLTLDDWTQDAYIALGAQRYAPRVRSESKWMSNFVRSHNDDVHVSGHSLGGTIANEIALRNHRVVGGATFNRGTTPFWRPTKSYKLTHYEDVMDPISGRINISDANTYYRIGNVWQNPHRSGWY